MVISLYRSYAEAGGFGRRKSAEVRAAGGVAIGWAPRVTIFANNRELLDRFRRGERDALAAVYYGYVDKVATLARRGFTMESSGHAYVRGHDADGERELVQDTFVKAFAAAARQAYDGVSPYRPYLLRITKNLMIDRHRAARRTAIELDGVGVGDIDQLLAANGELAGDEPEDDLHWKQLRGATQQYVATLDDESRQLIALRFVEELSQDDTASRMACSRRRVRTVEDRVLSGLRTSLKNRGLNES
jgi:RNA polymerase sigma-70 factor (ECF subfamily)